MSSSSFECNNNNNNACCSSSSPSSPPSVTRRRFDKFKAKLVELFFTNNTASEVEMTTTTGASKRKSAANTTSSNGPVTLSNYFYGYKTTDENNNSSSKRQQQPVANSIKSSASSSSMIVDIDENSASTILSTNSSNPSNNSSDCFSSTSSTYYYNNMDSINSCDVVWPLSSSSDAADYYYVNPFLDASLTDSLLSFNTDLTTLETHFEAAAQSLLTDDDQANLFNVEFMVNYVSYQLLVNLKKSSLLDLHSESTDLLKEISRHIYAQSENEPCGLKGCHMSIYLADSSSSSENHVHFQNEAASNKSSSSNNRLLAQFRFDSTCSLTTFELNLVLRQHQPDVDVDSAETDSEAVMSSDQTLLKNSSSRSSSFDLDTQTSFAATLKRRFLSGSSTNSFFSRPGGGGTLKQSGERQVYLDANSYDLFKRNFY